MDLSRRTEGGNEEICQSRVKAWGNSGLSGNRFLSVCLELSIAWQMAPSLWNLLHRQMSVFGRSARCSSEGTGWTWQDIGVQGYEKQIRTGEWSSCSMWPCAHCDVWSWWGGACSKMPNQKDGKAYRAFHKKGVTWVCSFDGHNKLMGYINSTFPLAVYGCIDTASRKLLWLRVWVTNSDPKVVGRWYLEYLYESRVPPSILRLDKGTEMEIITTMQAFLRQSHGNIYQCDTVIYGPSTSNQVLSKLLNT